MPKTTNMNRSAGLRRFGSPMQEVSRQNVDGAPQLFGASEQKKIGPRDLKTRSLRRMKVLHVVDSLDIGGTETQMLQVVERFDARFYDVTVGTLRSGGPLTEPLQKAGIRILAFPKHRTMFSWRAAYQLLRMAWFIRRERIDVVHAHDLWANQMAIPAARLAGARVILSSQRNLAHAVWYTPFRKKVVHWIHLLASGVIANSDAVREVLVKEFGIQYKHIHVIHNGVDCERIARIRRSRRDLFPFLSLDAKLIVNIGNMNSEVKGQAVLIEAARTICAAIPEVTIVLVGDGPLRAGLMDRVREIGLQERFLFLGLRSDVLQILSCADLFAFPSFAEGLPNSVLEAAALNVPVVATSVGGIPEIIQDGVSGLLVQPKDPQGLSEAILKILRNPDLAAKLAQASQERVCSEFGFKAVLSRLESLYGRS